MWVFTANFRAREHILVEIIRGDSSPKQKSQEHQFLQNKNSWWAELTCPFITLTIGGWLQVQLTTREWTQPSPEVPGLSQCRFRSILLCVVYNGARKVCNAIQTLSYHHCPAIDSILTCSCCHIGCRWSCHAFCVRDALDNPQVGICFCLVSAFPSFEQHVIRRKPGWKQGLGPRVLVGSV